jgi:hypothetical protein
VQHPVLAVVVAAHLMVPIPSPNQVTVALEVHRVAVAAGAAEG